MNGQPTQEEILEAINASGYLMEQKVASILEEQKFQVMTNQAYQDPDDPSKSREIDILASATIGDREDPSPKVWVELVCECKQNQSPFVFITRAKGKMDDFFNPSEHLFPRAGIRTSRRDSQGSAINAWVPPFLHFRLGQYHHFGQAKRKAVQFCKIVRCGKDKKHWEANHETVYDGILLPLMKAVRAQHRIFAKDQGAWETGQDIRLFFPVVVLHGEIYAVDSGASDVSLNPVPYIPYVRDVEMANLKGTFTIDFVRLANLQEYIEKAIMPFADRLDKLLRKDTEAFSRSD